VLFQNSPPTLSLSALFFPSQSCWWEHSEQTSESSDDWCNFRPAP
jgi:hypothetical protein